MLNIDQNSVRGSGGILSALSLRCCEYIRSITPSADLFLWPEESVRDLERIIVHTSPHLDEYFAELIFRACLPPEKRACEFVEQSIYSKKNDLTCQHLWPTAAVLGIGGTVSGGARSLFLFDEHVVDEEIGKSARTASSCSDLVVKKIMPNIPAPIQRVLLEVNAIDEFGNAHPQSIAGLIKSVHEVRFAFKIDPTSDKYIRGSLTPDWKRAIMDVCITAILYCLQENIDLIGDPDGKRRSLEASLDNYAANCPHRDNRDFGDALHWIRSNYLDQAGAFADAFLMQDEKTPIRDATGAPIPELFILGRVCFACEQCWGANIRDLIATHFWEVAMQGQLNFYPIKRSVEEMFNRNLAKLVTGVGFLRKEILPPIGLGGGWKCPVWIVSISPNSSVFLPQKGIQNFINENNNIDPGNKKNKKGCGLVLIHDSIQGTSALFKCSGVPESKWERLVKLIKEKESDCWHIVPNRKGGIAPFVVNGNKTHQYVPRTGLDITTLARLVQRTFY